MVTYRPAVDQALALVDALAPQVDTVVVVDNGSPAADVGALRDRLTVHGGELVALGENLGIAAAQNVGIARARALGARFVLLSDQDSLPAPDMVDRLLAGFAAAARGPVAAVGPITTDERNEGAALLFSDHRWGPRRADLPTTDGALVPVTFLIASGCLVDVGALDAVGGMDEGLFIDHVDLEWGLRARRAGFALYGVVGARLAHSLGDDTRRIAGRSRAVHLHSPTRNYYMARNTVALVRGDLLPTAWRWGYAAWITKYTVFYVLAVAPRARRLRLLVRGLVDGLRGRTGPLPAGRR